nr:uncharacterized protein LOC117219970 [Megalopta genalis]
MATDKVITEEVTASISSNESKEQISKNDDNANVLPLKEVEMKSYRSKDKESSSEESSEESSSEDEPSIKTEPPTPKNNNNDKNIQHMGIRKKRGIKSECENLPPVEDIKISMPEVLCDPVGKIIRVEKVSEYLKRRWKEETWNELARYRLGNEMRRRGYWEEEDDRRCRRCGGETETREGYRGR